MSIEQLKERLFAEGKNVGFTDLELYYEKKESLSHFLQVLRKYLKHIREVFRALL